MYVRRNYRDRFFRERNRKPSVVRRFLLALIFILGMGALGLWQQDLVIATTYDFIGPEQTATPLPGQLAGDAQTLFLAGDLDGAAEVWERVITMSPDNLDYLYEYGMLLIDLDDGRNGNAEQATEYAGRMLDLNPNDPRGYALRARGLVWTGSSSLAITVAQAGIDIAPDFAPLYAALSRAYIGDGNLREGQQNGSLAIEYGPGDVRSYWAYASSLAFSGARDEAILEYERAVSVNPNFLPPYFELANLYLASNRDQEAIDTYNRILGVQPTNARALLRQCQAFRKVGQFNQATGLCEDAVASDREYVPALFQLGQIQYGDSQFAAADESFQTCVDLVPDNLECTYYLGLTQYYLARETFDICQIEGVGAAECEASNVCQVGWNLLEDALVMTESRSNTDGDRDIITLGLSAIQDDPACIGVADGSLILPEATAEATPEATPEATQPAATADA